MIGSTWFILMLSANFCVSVWALFTFMRHLDTCIREGQSEENLVRFRTKYIVKILVVLICVIAVVASGMSINYFSV